ncbi:MAG TPA: hypothetical protein VGG32_03970 [Thermoplasmata archaeon]
MSGHRSDDRFVPAPAPKPPSAPFLALSTLSFILGVYLRFTRRTHSDRA